MTTPQLMSVAAIKYLMMTDPPVDARLSTFKVGPSPGSGVGPGSGGAGTLPRKAARFV